MIRKFWPLIILTGFIFVFFSRLFYPTLSIFMIPDFGESDVLHLNLPFKYILSASLKNGQWPLWTPYLANGFPMLAEGQIGTFYLPNLILFRFLPLIWAYNLNLIVAYSVTALGMYLFARKLRISPVASFFASLIFTFSGFLAVHLNHFNLIQAVSLLPFIFWSAIILWEKSKLKYAVLLAFFISQQIFTGHFYIVFITLVGLLVFLVGNIFFNNHKFIRQKFLVFIFSFFITFFLSAIQLLPTIELWQQSSRKAGLDFNAVTDYPYPFKHLFAFISPYFFGNPATGTYPSFSSDWGIFWENTAYVGLVPIVLFIASFFFLKNKIVRIFLLIFFISLFLVLGKNSPFYFIFSFPLFNMFRVPSKFLLLTTFSLAILAAYILEKIINWIVLSVKSQMQTAAYICDQKLIFRIFLAIIFFLVLFVDEYRFSYNYPPTTPAQWWTDTPKITKLIPENSKIASIGAPFLWNQVFKKEGWRDFTPYVYFKNSLYPNYNVFFPLSQADINTGGLIPRRLAFFISNIKDIQVDEDKKEASVSSMFANTVSMSGVEYIISAYKLNHPFFTLKNTIFPPEKTGSQPFFLFENKLARPRIYLSSTTRKIETLEDFTNQLNDEDFLNHKIALVEDETLSVENLPEAITAVSVTSETPTEIILEGNSDKNALLVFADTSYPGWKAYIDNTPTPIYNVNLVQRGIYFPDGKHQVKFIFQSDSFELGKKITILSSLIIFAAVFLSALTFARKSSGTRQLS